MKCKLLQIPLSSEVKEKHHIIDRNRQQLLDQVQQALDFIQTRRGLSDGWEIRGESTAALVRRKVQWDLAHSKRYGVPPELVQLEYGLFIFLLASFFIVVFLKND